MARYSKDAIEQFYDHNLFIPTRTLYLGDEEEGSVDFDTSRCVIKAFHILDSINSEPITILINTFGGCWFNGMAVYDTIKNARSHVDAYVVGSAMSMGSVILQAADKRFIYPNATIMVHDGGETLHGTPRTVINWAKRIEPTLNQMYRIYAERSGRSVDFWRKKCISDFIMSAEEARDLGLVDAIVGEDNG